MSRSVQNHLHHRRRFAGALILALAFHASLGLLPFPRFSGSWGLQGGTGGGAARGVREAFQAGAMQGTEVSVLVPAAPAPTPPAPADAPSETEPEPEPEEPDAEIAIVETPPSETAAPTADAPESETGAEAASAGAPGAANRGDAPGQGERGHGEPGGGLLPTGPIEQDLGPPRVWVHPQIPDVVYKRKINDEVILQLLVGTDGLVRDVRVLRAIPNCEECTQAAVAAARRHRYPGVTMQGQPVEVWTTSTIRFNSGR